MFSCERPDRHILDWALPQAVRTSGRCSRPAVAHEIEADRFRDHADAQARSVTCARVTRVMNLLLPAPPIREDILHLGVLPGAGADHRTKHLDGAA